MVERTATIQIKRLRANSCVSLQAEELDTHLQTLTGKVPVTLENGQSTYAYPLGSWVYHEKLKQMQLIFQMGFELSIYAPEELGGMYWYLSHLCSSHQLHIERIQAFVHSEGRRSKRFRGNEATFERTLTTLGRHSLWLIATETLSLGLQVLYVFLERHRVLPHAASQNAYSCARLRYELRMTPLLPISLSELVSYDQYEDNATLKGQNDSDLLKAEQLPMHAKHGKRSLRRALLSRPHSIRKTNSLRACIGASIAIQTVTKIFNKTNLSKSTAEEKPGTALLSIKVEIPEVGSAGRHHVDAPRCEDMCDRHCHPFALRCT
ncbi:conserved hypothetical protein [Talaromyces stipitatus ATCC 10500]|uniref:NAA35-like TPR repeats domain-containing protein n=1 Tax=Talaromyces stipitatus (strain ATCC 10500 / CBS 375.48 / QM 6759 / NRRL 1006) TaxID=441959 RepID=B8LYI4_TALSN|nr:uncharacterized protein TSTA_063880 [Talaromyces stipitatus ATCC 10500]EED22913.1 conserved hypothetical protein [Talaromyces stipitatus ATCC 10500]